MRWLIDVANPNGYLLHFENGPMATRHNVGTLDPRASGNVVIDRELFGWPLPARLRILQHEGVESVAFWDEEDPAAAGLPDIITDSPYAVTYIKIGESQLPDDSHDRVMRGASYILEPSGRN